MNLSPIYPASDSPEDQEAARRADGFLNRWFLDPLFYGSYPADMLELGGPFALRVEPGDMATIGQRLDFLGVNYYTRQVVRRAPLNPPLGMDYVQVPDTERTEMGWEVFPGLSHLLVRLRRDYKV